MTVLTIKGVNRDGRVERSERPAGIAKDAPVLVTFLPADRTRPRLESETADRERLRREAFDLMDRGLDLGGLPHLTCKENYDERIRELDERRIQGDG